MADDSLLKPADDIYLWVERGTSIMLKAVTSQGDPVELNEHELKEVIAALQLSLKRLQGEEAG
jgi:hypothetical protein